MKEPVDISTRFTEGHEAGHNGAAFNERVTSIEDAPAAKLSSQVLGLNLQIESCTFEINRLLQGLHKATQDADHLRIRKEMQGHLNLRKEITRKRNAMQAALNKLVRRGLKDKAN